MQNVRKLRFITELPWPKEVTMSPSYKVRRGKTLFVREEGIMKRSAKAIWKGTIRRGEGTVSTSSGVLNHLIYVTGTNDGEVPSTSSTEMLAASISSCMAVSIARELENAKISYENVEAKADIDVDLLRQGPEIAAIGVDVNVHTDEKKKALIEKAVQKARQSGALFRLLKSEVKVRLTVTPSVMAQAV